MKNNNSRRVVNAGAKAKAVSSGVQRIRRQPNISEGFELLTQHPRIRDEIRFRSNRWELLGRDKFWRVYHRSWARCRLTKGTGFALVGWKADSILLALRQEGEGLESDDPNPVLLANPEFKAEVRERHMPNVRRFFCHRGRTYYERHGEKWRSVPESSIRARIWKRIEEECGYWIWPKSHEACLEELKLEGKR